MSNLDIQLINRIKRGDRKAYTVIVEKYEQPLFNAALRITGDYDDARDVAQAAFVKAYEKLDHYDPAHKFYSWLYRIALNEAIDRVQKQKRHRRLDFDLASGQKTPEDDLEQAEKSLLLQKALARLSLDHRLIIILKHLLFLSYRDIADILDIQDKTVKSRLFTARQALKSSLAKEGYP